MRQRNVGRSLHRAAMLLAGLMEALAVTMGARASAIPAPSGYNWLQFGFDQQHSGDNTQETAITTANVGTLRQLFSVPLPAVADGAPAYLSGVSTPLGVKDLLFLTTKDGAIVALDAHNGSIVWSHRPSPIPNPCSINGSGGACYTTSSPAIDPGLGYVYSYGLDGKVHKYLVGTGTEIITGGWPEMTTLKAFDEKGSPALAIATASGVNYLYMANGGYPGDNGDYQGHITAINLVDGTQTVFNALCSNQTVHFAEQPSTPDCAQVQSAIWARPGAVYDAATGRIYMATGNGDFDPSSFGWGDSVLALHADGTGVGNGDPLDSYTPANFQSLQDSDLDLGSTAPAIITTVPAGSGVTHLAVQAGKDARLRLLNLDNLSGMGGSGHTGGELRILDVPQGGEVLPQPAVWSTAGTSDVFVANDNGIAGMQVTVPNGSTTPTLTKIWPAGTMFAPGGASPIVANGVLFYAAHDNHIYALDATSGAQLWSGAIGGVHWESPIVDNGILYITDESGKLTAFALPAANTPTPTFTPSPTATATPSGSTAWSRLNSGSGDWLKGISCSNPAACFAVGDNGAELSTTNGGASWAAQNSGTTTTLYSVSCASWALCISVGLNGTIQGTSNGGSTWSAQTSGTTNTLHTVSCPSSTNCIAFGNNGTILTTANDGSNWVQQSTGTSNYFYGGACPSLYTCIAVGGNGTILVTTNGGSSWNAQASRGGAMSSQAGGGSIWSTQANGTGFWSAPHGAGVVWQAQATGVSASLRAAACPTVTTCFVVGDSGTIVATTNRGSSWTTESSGTSVALLGVSCVDTSTCYAVGAGGVIVATTNGGASWSVQPSGTGVTLYAASCTSDGTCYADGDAGTILRRAG